MISPVSTIWGLHQRLTNSSCVVVVYISWYGLILAVLPSVWLLYRMLNADWQVKVPQTLPEVQWTLQEVHWTSM